MLVTSNSVPDPDGRVRCCRTHRRGAGKGCPRRLAQSLARERVRQRGGAGTPLRGSFTHLSRVSETAGAIGRRELLVPGPRFDGGGLTGRLFFLKHPAQQICLVLRIHVDVLAARPVTSHYVLLRTRSYFLDSSTVAGVAAERSESGVTTIVMPGSTMAATALLKASGTL